LSTSNSELLHRVAYDQPIWRVWESHAERKPNSPAIVHLHAGQEPIRLTWEALWSVARVYSALLCEAGVRRGDVCAIILRHDRRFYPLYMAIELLGAIPAVLAYPNSRLHPDKFRAGLQGMSRRSGLDWLLTERELASTVAPLATGTDSTVRGILLPLEWGCEPFPSRVMDRPHVDAGAACLLQHSSGTTGLQKAVMLSHRAVLEHVRRYGAAIAATPDDSVVSWLPLYHDMGLIAAFHLPLALGIPSIQLDPFEWVMAPVILLEAISREQATLTWLPNFAYNLLADRVHDEDLENIRLDSLRMVINCSEPVRAESHRRFVERFSPHGLRPTALAACYAMAETTFAVTQTRPGQAARVLQADRRLLLEGQFEPARPGQPARPCVSSGHAISGCELRVVRKDGSPANDGEIGELVIKSVSSFSGYRNYDEETQRVLRQGWYHSGDVGFVHEGECYVIGRNKDIIIVAGKNVYPEDIEDAVGEVVGVLPGRVVAFGTEDPATGTELVWVVAETDRSTPDEKRQLEVAVKAAGASVDVTIQRVHLVEPRWLIKSSAGKPSRAANRDRVLELVRQES
jgi:fatty-acyl-CoA synthase